MSKNANSTRGAKRTGRPWYRLHLSTCVVLLLVATGLVLVIVPGDSGGLAGPPLGLAIRNKREPAA